MKEYPGEYHKWRSRIMKANFYLVTIMFILEVVIYFVLKHRNLIIQSITVYLMCYIVIPTMLNLLIIYVGNSIIQKTNPKKEIINYLPVIQMTFLCLVAASTHYIFSATLCVFCFPVFITVLFNDKRMTQRITILSILFLGLSLVSRYYSSPAPQDDIYLVPEGLVALTIIISTNVVCRILVGFQNEKNRILEKAYRSQVVMQEQLNRDQKTGLYGANAFSNALQEAIYEPNGDPIILAVIDIDDFKKVNDSYGHAKGDKVLKRLAGLMMRDGSDDIFPARFGGEEFAIIFRMNLAQADRWMEELRLKFASQRYDFMGGRVTISIGIAVWEEGFTDEQLFINADTAMYYSKQHGKNIVTLYDSRMQEGF
ncbi:MAG: GGDEF domain-containing protein [Clostridium sp.]